MKLSKRLQHIDQMVTGDYDQIWDCCCDHGFLGASLLSQQTTKNIHFVDILPDLIDQVENKLQQFYVHSPSAWKTHCLDITDLPLGEYEGKHLIIIAGVGGDLMIEFIDALQQQFSNLELDYLLCPVHHQFAVRKKLIELDFSLQRESLVEENKRFYEVLLVSSVGGVSSPVSAVGSEIWQSNTAEQAEVVGKYLDKTLNHYRRIQQGKSSEVDHIVSAYESVIL